MVWNASLELIDTNNRLADILVNISSMLNVTNSQVADIHNRVANTSSQLRGINSQLADING